MRFLFQSALLLLFTQTVLADGGATAIEAPAENAGEAVEEIEELVEFEEIERPVAKMPMLWPIHGVVTGYATLLLVIAMFIARNKINDRHWLPKHQTLGMVVVGILLIGLSVAVYMVSLWSAQHLRVGHAYFGVSIAALMIVVPMLGWFVIKGMGKPSLLRPLHRWAGRATILLMLIACLLGWLTVQ